MGCCESGCCGTYPGKNSGRGCCGVPRSFLTKEEKVEMLTEYKESLEKELKGISERIAELKKAN